MIRCIASIHYRRINGKLIYYQHITIGSALIRALQWKAGMRIAVSSNDLCMELAPDKAGFVLGKFGNRPGTLWLNYQITALDRRNFLHRQSNGIAIKVCWRPGVAAFQCVNGVLTLYGAGAPFNKGVNRIR